MGSLSSDYKSVSELVDDFESGSIAIPEIQREVVWDGDQVKDLIDSIDKGFPCGCLIFWEPRERDKSLVRTMIRPERMVQFDGKTPRYFLLDGQQRVTALASVTLNRQLFNTLLREREDEMPFIVANLKQFPRGIEARTVGTGLRFPEVLFNDLFNGTAQARPEYASLLPDQADKIKKYIQRLRDYKFPVQIISDRTYAEVGKIFMRVNSMGTQLTGAEIHLATIVPHWKGITKEFRDYRTQLGQTHYELDFTFFMRAVSIVQCGVPRIKKLADTVADDNRPSRKQLDRSWKLARTATDKLIRVLQRELFLDRSKYFTSQNALVPIIYYLAKAGNNRPASKMIQRFFLLSQLSGHYGGASETVLNRDFRIMKDPDLTLRQGFEELVNSVERDARRDYPRLKIKPSQVSGVSSKNVFVLFMYVLMRSRGASDWDLSRDCKKLFEIEPEHMHLHHIFPSNFITAEKAAKKVYKDNGRSDAEFRADVNDIANLTFLSQARNNDIRDNDPRIYLPQCTTKEIRKAHFIPEDPDLWKPENFRGFLEERRRLLAKAMTSFLKKLR
jgi:hypothetical protein